MDDTTKPITLDEVRKMRDHAIELAFQELDLDTKIRNAAAEGKSCVSIKPLNGRGEYLAVHISKVYPEFYVEYHPSRFDQRIGAMLHDFVVVSWAL